MELISLYLNQEDALQVKKIFNESDDPGFTIVGEAVSDAFVHLSIYFESSIHLWHLAKTVEMYNAHNKRMKELRKQLNKV
jgi:hypothetical protein